MTLNVLVVDDSLVMRKMVLRTLSIAGLPMDEVYEAESAEEGLELLEQSEVNIALLDINLPGMNGIELLELMRTKDKLKEVPVVMVSTEGSAPRLERVKKQNAGFVRKPFAPETLVQAIFDAIGKTA